RNADDKKADDKEAARAQDAAARRAARWALRHGGNVTLVGEVTPVKIAADLPAGPFRVSQVNLWETRPKGPPGGGDLDAPGGLGDLDVLRLWAPALSDRGVERLSDQPFARRLTELHLHGKEITDAGVALLPRFEGLVELTVRECPKVSGAGLERLLEL